MSPLPRGHNIQISGADSIGNSYQHMEYVVNSNQDSARIDTDTAQYDQGEDAIGNGRGDNTCPQDLLTFDSRDASPRELAENSLTISLEDFSSHQIHLKKVPEAASMTF